MPELRQTMLPAIFYEIEVRGCLDESWSDWFSGMAIVPEETGSENGITILKGRIIDQAALRGILTRLWDMNLEIVSIQQLLLLAEEEEQDE